MLKNLVVITLVIVAAVSGFSQKSETASEKAKREQAERAAIIAQNESITRSNEAITQAFAAGNAALAAKNYDAAIVEYDKGISASPGHPGLSSLHTNKSVALRSRGVREFNAAVAVTDPASKEARINTARKDFLAALAAANEALKAFSSQPQPANAAETSAYKANKYAVLSNLAESYRLVVSKVDKTRTEAAMNAYKEYWLVEESAAKRSKTRNDVGMMLTEVGMYDRAATEFRSVLSSDSENIDALFGLGYSLFGTGSKANFREALTALQKFDQLAPPSHPRKEDAKMMLDYLKGELGV